MQAFKTRAFVNWADGEGLGDEALGAAVAEMEQGLIDARLGGQVVKKRAALPGRGKRTRECHGERTASVEIVGEGVIELLEGVACQGD
jgi:hypothetical protein